MMIKHEVNKQDKMFFSRRRRKKMRPSFFLWSLCSFLSKLTKGRLQLFYLPSIVSCNISQTLYLTLHGSFWGDAGVSTAFVQPAAVHSPYLSRLLLDRKPVVEIWPEVERAECLARGAALKWASGVFCRPEHLERLSQYRKRESQRTTSVHTRLKVTDAQRSHTHSHT